MHDCGYKLLIMTRLIGSMRNQRLHFHSHCLYTKRYKNYHNEYLAIYIKCWFDTAKCLSLPQGINAKCCVGRFNVTKKQCAMCIPLNLNSRYRMVRTKGELSINVNCFANNIKQMIFDASHIIKYLQNIPAIFVKKNGNILLHETNIRGTCL